jgi:hypothetical protein
VLEKKKERLAVIKLKNVRQEIIDLDLDIKTMPKVKKGRAFGYV